MLRKGSVHVSPEMFHVVLRITKKHFNEEYRSLLVRVEADPDDLYLFKLSDGLFGLLYRRCKLVNPATRLEGS